MDSALVHRIVTTTVENHAILKAASGESLIVQLHGLIFEIDVLVFLPLHAAMVSGKQMVS